MATTKNSSTRSAAAPATANTQPAATPASPPATSPPATPPVAPPAPAASPPPAADATPPAGSAAGASIVTSIANGANKGTKVDLQTSYVALVVGLQANYQPDDVFELPMGNMTRDQVVAVITSFVGSAEATKASYLAWRQDVQTERVAEQAATPVAAAVKVVLVGKYGRSSPTLLAYGIAPAKVPVVSPAARAAAIAKAKATREARGTKGKVQKAAITGNVTGVIITPVTAGPPAPAADGASASNGASGATGSNAGNGSGSASGAGAPAATAATTGAGSAPKT